MDPVPPVVLGGEIVERYEQRLFTGMIIPDNCTAHELRNEVEEW